MFQAQYLFAGNVVFSPWMERGGDNLIATVDLIANASSGVQVEVYQKNSEQTGDGFAHPNEDSSGTATSTKLSETALKQTSATFSGVMELVRFRITTTTGSGDNRILFRMLSNIWFDDVKA